MGRKVVKKNIAGCYQQIFEYKRFVDNAQQCFAFTLQANFPPIIWIFAAGEDDEIKSRLYFKSSLLYTQNHVLPESW